jgi:hypothetical protein
MPSRRPLEERFWEKVDKDGPTMPGMATRCWVWTGAKSEGYGYIGLGNGKVGKATRVSWELHFDPLPANKCALHRCDNPACVRPDHLFEGTHKDNAIDRENKGRMPHPTGDDHWARRAPERLARGSQHGNALLREEQVVELRTAYTGKYGELTAFARKYNVDVQTVRRALRGETYANVGA